MQFPDRDLTSQYISSSYQDVLQQYPSGSSLLYVLDGYGNVVFSIPSASIGSIIITSDITSSMTVLSASYSNIIDVTVYKESSSFASSSISTSFSETSSLAITASYAIIAQAAYYADISELALSSSMSDTASYIDSNTISHNQLQGLQPDSAVEFYHLDSASYVRIQSGTASYANTASVAIYALNAEGTALITGSTYSITASWAENAVNGGTQLVTGSTYSITASSAISASWAPFIDLGTVLYTGSTYPITSSWTINSITASIATSVSFAYQTPLVTGSTIFITSSWANSVSGYQTTLTTGSTIPITASHAVSASWAPSSTGGTTLYTGSIYPITSSWAQSSSYAISASYSPGGSPATYTSSLFGTASWANYAETASYINIIPSGSTESASYAVTASYAVAAGRLTDSGLTIPQYDYSNVTYAGPWGQVDECKYYLGGISGSLVAKVTALYSGNEFTGISKSLA